MNDDNTRDPLQLRLDRRSEKIMYIIAGCNGAGKTTAFRRSLYESLGRPEFINSDEIARSLCPEDVDSVQVSAGRLAIESLHAHLAGDESALILEDILRHLQEAHRNGFKVALFYYWLDTPDLAVERVKLRVKKGGHNVPEATIRDRYDKSVRYLSTLYIPKVDFWKIVNNSGLMPLDVATSVTEIKNRIMFNDLISYGQDNQNR